MHTTTKINHNDEKNQSASSSLKKQQNKIAI
jgi:hypothetical protein